MLVRGCIHSYYITVIRNWHLWTQDKTCDSPTYNICDSNTDTHPSHITVYNYCKGQTLEEIRKSEIILVNYSKDCVFFFIYIKWNVKFILKINLSETTCTHFTCSCLSSSHLQTKGGRMRESYLLRKDKKEKKRREKHIHTFAMVFPPSAGSHIICSRASVFPPPWAVTIKWHCLVHFTWNSGAESFFNSCFYHVDIKWFFREN